MSLFQLIESYKNGGSLLIQGPDRCSLLHHAAKTGNGEIVKYILDHGESVCAANRGARVRESELTFIFGMVGTLSNCQLTPSA